MTEEESWFLRRHDYRPSAIGLTTPPPSQQPLQPVTQSPAAQYNPVVPTPGEISSNISAQLDRTNQLLEELLRLNAHNNVIEYDIDISDSVSYSLSSSEAAIVSYTVPSNYVMLLREFFTSLRDDTTYYVYLNDEIFQYIPDMSFPGMGIAISSQVTFKMYVLNTYASTQSYTTTINASLRREAHWLYPTYSYKKPV